MKGTVEKWMDKGFGFITPETGGDNIFVHATNIVGATELKEGQKVEFDVEDAPKGPRAINVKLV